ncbi:MAG TPA: hypothetical protein VGL53_29330, partial [Bryobacteraceae bacterium]
MKTPVVSLLILIAAAAAFAQTPVAPSFEPVGPPKGEKWGDYNINDSFEAGYRFATVGGSLEKYQSDVNYGNGIRLLSSSFSMFSRDGKGKWFDDLLITTQGLGNDPYESAMLRIAKNHWYRYDMTWRENDYINQGLSIAAGYHAMATTHQLQDHNLTLFPQSKTKFFFGYGRSSQDGPALSTINLFGTGGNEYPVLMNVKRQQNEYRLGGETVLAGFRINIMHGWSDYKDDTPVVAPANTTDLNGAGSVLTSYFRGEPIHGTSPYWRGTVFRDVSHWFSMNAKFSFTNGKGQFIQDESYAGASPLFGNFNSLILVYGAARRPVTNGFMTLSLYPSKRLTITNQSSVSNVRMTGDNFYQEFNLATLATALYNFQVLDIRTVSNSTLVNFQFNRWFGVFGGYEYSDRQIRSVQSQLIGDSNESFSATQTNIVHTGSGGLRIRPIKPLTIVLDSEVGRANLPIYPTSEKNFQTLGARVQLKLKNVTLGARAGADYNYNSTALNAFSSHSRTYSVDGSWTPRTWFSFTGGYSKIHLDTASGLVYYLLFTQASSQYDYVSNLHSIYAQARFSIAKRVDLMAGLSSVQDLGDGRNLNGPL